jgi:hypothetical protein
MTSRQICDDEWSELSERQQSMYVNWICDRSWQSKYLIGKWSKYFGIWCGEYLYKKGLRIKKIHGVENHN